MNVIEKSIEAGILTITLNRPDKLNALSQDVLEQLNSTFTQVYTDLEIKGVIITGSGTKAFAAGADIASFPTLNALQAQQMARKGQEVFFKIENCPKPVIAAVNGYALGGGCELAMACHIRIASGNALFGQPEVNLGLIPGYGGTQRLTQLIGKGRALELIMTGNSIPAAEAYRIGLVNQLVSQEELLPTVNGLMNVMLSKSPAAITGSIHCVQAVYEKDKNGYEEEAKTFGNLFNTADAMEGIRAFLEKRKPLFTGK